MELSVIQIIGYLASIIIALSMTMNSIVKFRWINLIGASSMSAYGFIFGAIPVGILNGFIVSVDVYYLLQIYNKREIFETLEIRAENKYLIRFLEYYNNDIQKFFPGFSYKPELNTISFFILRNMSVTGIFLAHREDGEILKIGLDYVIPEYRDFKNGKYIFNRVKNRFVGMGFTKIIAPASSKQYINYLKKLNFYENNNNQYEIILK